MKTIFWNVDTQYDFMRNDEEFRGALTVENARTIEGNLERLTKYAEKNDVQVVNTADWHTPESKEFSENPDFMKTFPPHCLSGTKGAEYVPATKPKDPYTIDWRSESFDESEVKSRRELVLYKDAFDIFSGSPHSDKVVDTINPDRVIVYGVATNVCVNYAVNGLLERGVETYVVADAIKELPNLPLDEVLKSWTSKGAKLVTTDYVLQGGLE